MSIIWNDSSSSCFCASPITGLPRSSVSVRCRRSDGDRSGDGGRSSSSSPHRGMLATRRLKASSCSSRRRRYVASGLESSSSPSFDDERRRNEFWRERDDGERLRKEPPDGERSRPGGESSGDGERSGERSRCGLPATVCGAAGGARGGGDCGRGGSLMLSADFALMPPSMSARTASALRLSRPPMVVPLRRRATFGTSPTMAEVA